MSGSEAMPKMYADLFQQLLTFVEFAVKPPKFGKVDAKSVSLMKTNQVIIKSVWVSVWGGGFLGLFEILNDMGPLT